jgi:hypothetical protein
MQSGGLSLRYKTSTCQKIPADFQEKLLNFQPCIIQLMKKQNYVFTLTGNAEEKAVHCDVPQYYAADAKYAKKLKLEAHIMKSSM